MIRTSSYVAGLVNTNDFQEFREGTRPGFCRYQENKLYIYSFPTLRVKHYHPFLAWVSPASPSTLEFHSRSSSWQHVRSLAVFLDLCPASSNMATIANYHHCLALILEWA